LRKHKEATMRKFSGIFFALFVTVALYAGSLTLPFKGKVISRATFNDTSTAVVLDYSDKVNYAFNLINIDSAYGTMYVQGLINSTWLTLETVAIDTAELFKLGTFRTPTVDSLQGVERIRVVFAGGCIGNDSSGAYNLQILTK